MAERERACEDIAGRMAVIVGAAGGIGRAISARLAEAGCRLALLDADRGALRRALADLALDDVLVLPADITDANQVQQAAKAVEEAWGAPDILVNAAGINTPERTLDDMADDQWDHVINVNLTGVFLCTRAFLAMMRRKGGGVIVNIASTSALSATPGGGAHYCAAKRALLSLTESINVEQGRHGIRACALSPGEVDTPLVDRRPQPPSPERRAAMLKPVDIADAVHFVVTRPPRVTIGELVVWPSSQISGRYVV